MQKALQIAYDAQFALQCHYAAEAGFHHVSVNFNEVPPKTEEEWKAITEDVGNILVKNGLACVQTHLKYHDLLESSEVPDEVTEEICEVCGKNMVIKMGRFGKFLACPGWPECTNTKPLVERMPGRCPKCDSGMLKRKSKRGYAYYACERGAECGFMSWDVPTAEDCPKCGKSMFKKSGKGRMKPFCINEACENFLPEDKRGYYKKPTAVTEEGEPPAEAEKKPATKKTAAKKTTKKTESAEKKSAAKKTTTRKIVKKADENDA
jgi:ssDNA-binding Zn-finger/Zn-ribbon topoisomerase 1